MENKNITHEDLKKVLFGDVKIYQEDEHFIRKLIKEEESEQLYFYEYKEERDYNGNDPQYRTYIPVKNEQEADEIAKLDIMEIHKITPRLIDDWLADDSRITKWL